MTPVTSTGSISNSSCLKCEKVFSLADQLSKSMHEFEVFTMEMEFDPKSAKSKSSKILSNFWQLISTIQSLKIGQEAEIEKGLCTNQTLTSIVVSVEQPEAQSQSQNLEQENAPAKAKSKSNAVHKMSKMRNGQQPKPMPMPIPNPNMTPKRLNELKRAKALLRTMKCETEGGFYNLFECLKCQRQFSQEGNALRHIQNVHLKLSALCPTCSNPFFTKESLELHVSKCSKREQFKKIKVWLKNDSQKLVKVPLQPHEKPEQKQKPAPLTRNQKRNQNQKSSKTVTNQRGRPRKTHDPLKIKVNNPFDDFSLEKTLNVKVKIERLKMQKMGDISIISQILTSENNEIGNGKRNEFRIHRS